MKFLKILSFFLFSFLLSSQAYGFINFDVLGHGGYSSLEENGKSEKLEGYYAGVSALLSATGPISLVMGAGGQTMKTKGNVSGVSTTISSTSAVGHTGLRLSTPFTRIYLLANGGYGLEGKSEVASGSVDLKNHIFYGGTFMGLLSFGHVLKFGVTATYNVHQFEVSSTKNSSHEVSAGVVFGVGL